MTTSCPIGFSPFWAGEGFTQESTSWVDLQVTIFFLVRALAPISSAKTRARNAGNRSTAPRRCFRQGGHLIPQNGRSPSNMLRLDSGGGTHAIVV